MLLTSWDTEEHTRMIGQHLQEMRDMAEADRQARSARTPQPPRTLRRVMGGALIAAGRALAA